MATPRPLSCRLAARVLSGVCRLLRLSLVQACDRAHRAVLHLRAGAAGRHQYGGPTDEDHRQERPAKDGKTGGGRDRRGVQHERARHRGAQRSASCAVKPGDHGCAGDAGRGAAESRRCRKRHRYERGARQDWVRRRDHGPDGNGAITVAGTRCRRAACRHERGALQLCRRRCRACGDDVQRQHRSSKKHHDPEQGESPLSECIHEVSPLFLLWRRL